MKCHVVTAVCLAAACSRTPSPKDPTERALFRDLERLVTVTETTGWGSDRLEVDGLLDQAFDSTCRVDALGRRSLLAWLDAEVARQGGPIEEAWRANGKSMKRISDLVVVHRVRMLLARAEERSLDCPFWLEPENPFGGRQINERGWALTFGYGGKAILLRQGSRRDLSFGGAGRLLLGRTLTDGDAVFAGLELGASALFPKDATGDRMSLQLGADFVTPIVYRRSLTNTYLEVEGGWLGHANENDWTALEHGIHLGVAFGGRTLRQRFLFPGAAFGLQYEQLFVGGQDLIRIKFGLRAAFDLDLR
jgi:hypothetical protein